MERLGYNLSHDQQQKAVQLLIRTYKSVLNHRNVLDDTLTNDLVTFLAIMKVDLCEVLTEGREQLY